MPTFARVFPVLGLGAFAVFAGCLGCGIGQQPPVEQRVWDISAPALVRSYSDRSEAWTGQRVRVLLPAKTYLTRAESVAWHIAENRPPAITFTGLVPPTDNLRNIIIVGQCVGHKRDGQERGGGVDFVVEITGCVLGMP